MTRQPKFVAVVGFAFVLAASVIVSSIGGDADHASAAGPATLSISNTGLTITLAASGSGVDPYKGYNFSFPFDPTLVAFSGTANSMPGSPFCVDNAGVGDVANVGCTLLNGSSTFTGDLGSITLVAAGAKVGCLTVTITAYSAAKGNADSGTYTLDASANPTSNPLSTASLQVPVNTQSCQGLPTDTPTHTPTVRPTDVPATATPCPGGACKFSPTPAGIRTHTPTVTATATPVAPTVGAPPPAPPTGNNGSAAAGTAKGPIRLPDTGSGGGDPFATSWWMWIAAELLVVGMLTLIVRRRLQG